MNDNKMVYKNFSRHSRSFQYEKIVLCLYWLNANSKDKLKGNRSECQIVNCRQERKDECLVKLVSFPNSNELDGNICHVESLNKSNTSMKISEDNRSFELQLIVDD